MKIAFIGGVKFSHELLLHILNLGWEVSVVFSYADSKKNTIVILLLLIKLQKNLTYFM